MIKSLSRTNAIEEKKCDDGYIRNRILSPGFFERDTLTAARDLLGKVLLKKSDGQWCGGIIVETEAYLGDGDPACHAARGMTPRNKVMFGPVGRAYVYFIYGMYHCFNVVAFDSKSQKAGAVLIRALEPVAGISAMKMRRNREKLRELTNGPGKLCQAMGITGEDNGVSLIKGKFILIDNEEGYRVTSIIDDTRIGIKEGAEHPFRFYLEGNPYVSRKAKQ